MSPHSDQYLVEFLEAGGVVTLLDVLRSPQVKEDDKAAALRLLLNISDAARKYKEFICENNGRRRYFKMLPHYSAPLTSAPPPCRRCGDLIRLHGGFRRR